MIPFVQLEFAGAVGLPEGRYRAEADDGERVLIVQILGAPRPTRRGRRRPRPVKPGEPDQVPVTRLTVAGAERFGDRDDATRWLESASGSAEGRTAQVRAATTTIN
ncbi:MAG: hypothetical protein ACRDKH_01460, partial [Solirubrobacterales bacterium]